VSLTFTYLDDSPAPEDTIVIIIPITASSNQHAVFIVTCGTQQVLSVVGW